jgi:hypothetical protein
MAFKSHPRLVTKQQFAEGTTIDGSRIDDAMQDIVDRANSVPAGDFASRYMRTQYVSGWTPFHTNTNETHHFPWMPHVNNKTQVVGLSTDPPSGSFNNVERVKGIEAPGIKAEFGDEGINLIGHHQIWETSYFFHKPCIVEDIRLFILTSHPDASGRIYTTTFLYEGSAPSGYSSGEPTEDLSIVFSVDDEFNREDRSKASVEAIRTGFQVPYKSVSQIKIPDANNTGSPASMLPINHHDGAPYGVYVPMTGLNIPIHQNARGRLAVSIPYYATASVSSWPDTNPWQAGNFSLTMTVLEEISG